MLFPVMMFIVLFATNYLALSAFFLSWIPALTLTLLMPLGFILEKHFHNKVTSYLYRGSIAIFEAMWILLSLVALSWLLFYFGYIVDPVIIFSLWVFFVMLGLLYAQTWKTTKLTIYSDKIKKKIRIVQLTDIHAFGAYAKKWVDDAVNRARALKPDMIVLTGDIIDQPSVPPKHTLHLEGKIPMYYTLGNHEFYLGDGVAVKQVGKSVRLLRNTSVENGDINIIGIDDSPSKEQVASYISDLIHTTKFNLLLYHRPRGMKAAADAGVDLMLSGHTHGGVNFPMHVFVSLVYGKYYRGLHKIKEMLLYTSNGAGTRNWPLRLFNPQEIVQIDIVPSR